MRKLFVVSLLVSLAACGQQPEVNQSPEQQVDVEDKYVLIVEYVLQSDTTPEMIEADTIRMKNAFAACSLEKGAGITINDVACLEKHVSERVHLSLERE